MRTTSAERVATLLFDLAGVELPVRLRSWDGSEAGPPDATARLVLHRPRAVRTLVWQPDDLGLARAYVGGDLDVEGDLQAAFDVPELMARITGNQDWGRTPAREAHALLTAARLGALGPRPPLPPEEVVPRRRLLRHSKERDEASVRHHYDVGNDFYRLLLGPTLVYSCAYWRDPAVGLDRAQEDKLELVCRKLGLRPGMRLLDVGCGWGGLLVHAARHHGVTAVGVTLSPPQAELARERLREAGLDDRVEVRVQDYRDVDDGPYDAIASIGMAEHVGAEHLPGYGAHLAGLLAPTGRLLNHAISNRPKGEHGVLPPRPSFIDRYVFPDGEILPVGMVVDRLERAGLEVRDVHDLREHYALTLCAWSDRLEARWDEAVALAGEGRARTWRLYLAGSALAFRHGDIAVHQVLALRHGPRGESGMPLTRDGWGVSAPPPSSPPR